MSPSLHLRVEHEAGARETAKLTTHLVDALSLPAILRAAPLARPSEPGERAVDVPILGQLALTFLGGGAATALINVLTAWLPRRSETKVELTLPDGSGLVLSGTDLTPTKVAAYIKTLKKFEPATNA